MSEKLSDAAAKLRALPTSRIKEALVSGVLPWMSYEEAARQRTDQKLAELAKQVQELMEAAGVEPTPTPPGPTPEPPQPSSIIKVPASSALPNFGTIAAGTQVQLERGGTWQRIDLRGGKKFSIVPFGDTAKPLPMIRGGGIFVPGGTQDVVMTGLDVADCAIGMNVVPHAGVARITLKDSKISRTSDSGIIDYSEDSNFIGVTVDQAGAAGTASHGIYANGRYTRIDGCTVTRAAKNGISLRMDGQEVLHCKISGTSIGIAFFTELDPRTESGGPRNLIENNAISDCSVAMYISAAGGWPGGQEPSKPWVYPPFDINNNQISNPRGQAQGIMCEIPVRSHLGNAFSGAFSVKEKYV